MSAFKLNIIVILFFLINAIYFDLIICYITAGVFTMILPACDTKRKTNE